MKELKLYQCPNCNVDGVLPMSDGRCPNCKRPLDTEDDKFLSSKMQERNSVNERQWHPYRNRPLGLLLYVIGLPLVIAALIIFGLQRTNHYSLFNSTILTSLSYTFLGFLGGYLMLTGRKLWARQASEVLNKDKRPPVVYLRSFSDEGKEPMSPLPWMGGVSDRSDEQYLAAVMKKIGPFVAIGRPGEKLPELGSARMYVGSDQWRHKIEELLARAQLVVLRIGITEGLLWEVERASKIVSPTRLLFFFGWTNYSKQVEQTYKQFKVQAEKILPCSLPESVGKARFMAFDSDWNARLIRTSGSFTLSHEKQMTKVLRSVFEQNTIPVPKFSRMSLSFKIILGILFFLLVALVVFGLKVSRA